MFRSLQCSKNPPILGTRDIQRAIESSSNSLASGQRLETKQVLRTASDLRDAVELPTQFQFEHEMGTIRLRYPIEDPDVPFASDSMFRTRCTILAVGLLLLAPLSGCDEGNVRLSPAETVTCARDRLKGHVGTVSQTRDAIIYSYDSANGPAKVIVTFDAKRRHVSTFFESTPYGTHEELMEATEAIKNCAEYGRALKRAKGSALNNFGV